MKKIILILISLTAPLTFASHDDLLFDGAAHKIGFNIGFGSQRVRNASLGVNYTYDATFYQLQYYRALKQRSTWGIDLLLQPQYNKTRFIQHVGDTALIEGYEAGINVGFLFRKNFLNDRISLYLLASIGPHYVSGTPDRQVSGFIFSDNFDLGLQIELDEKLYLDIRPGIRHISNGSTRHPNGGVNDITFDIGFMYLL